MGALAREGNAAFVLTASSGIAYTHLLNRPLTFVAAPSRQTNRYERDSLDLSAREVIAIGGGRMEVETLVRFERKSQSLVDLLAYAADGSVVTYYPDLDIPTGYALWLVGQGEMVTLAPEDGRMAYQEYTVPVRFRDASASGAALEALFSPWLFRYDASFASRLITFTRSGTVGPYTGRDGVLGSAAANIPRTEWLDLNADKIFETPALLLEVARTNLVTSDDLTAWTQAATPVITSGISDPAGGTAAYRVADDYALDSEYLVRTVTFTGNAVKSAVFVVREATMASSGVQALRIFDATAGAARLSLDISAWTLGVPTVAAGTGTYLGKRYAGNGYWALYGLTTSVTAANSNRVEIIPAISGVSPTGSLDVYRVNAYDSTTPGWSILDASETRNVDTWYAAFAHVPQAVTVYVKFIEGMATTWPGNEGVLHIGTAGMTGPLLHWYRASGTDLYIFKHSNGTSGVEVSVDINPTWGQTVELRGVLNADGSVVAAGRLNGGTEVVSSASAALALANAWGDTRLYFNGRGTIDAGLVAFISVKLAAGVKSMAEMTAL